MGQTVGKIKLQEGYNLEYENLSGEEKMKFTKKLEPMVLLCLLIL